MKNFDKIVASHPEADFIELGLQFYMGSASANEDGTYSTPHGKVAIQEARKATKAQRQSTKPYPGEFKYNGKKHYILFA